MDENDFTKVNSGKVLAKGFYQKNGSKFYFDKITLDELNEYAEQAEKSANALRRDMEVSRNQPVKPLEQSYNLTKSNLSTAIRDVINDTAN